MRPLRTGSDLGGGPRRGAAGTRPGHMHPGPARGPALELESARGATCSLPGAAGHEAPAHRGCGLYARAARRPLLLVRPRWGAAGRRTAGGIIPVVAWVSGGWSRPILERVTCALSGGYGSCISDLMRGPNHFRVVRGSVGYGPLATCIGPEMQRWAPASRPGWSACRAPPPLASVCNTQKLFLPVRKTFCAVDLPVVSFPLSMMQ